MWKPTLLLGIVVTVWLLVKHAGVAQASNNPRDKGYEQPSWEVVHGFHPRTPLYAAAKGDGKLVVVGRGDGLLLLSEDGSPKNLKEQNSSTYLPLFGVAFGGGRFVAVGDNGVIISSPDGKTWTLHHQNLWCWGGSGCYSAFYDVAYGAGRFVTVSTKGEVMVSGDGFNWVEAGVVYLRGHDDSIYNFRVYSLLHDGRRFVAFGEPWFAPEESVVVGYSLDGVSWRTQNLPFIMRVAKAVYAKGKYVVVGDEGKVLFSEGGANWTMRKLDTESDLVGVAYGAGVFVALSSDGTVFRSENGTRWSKTGSISDNTLLWSSLLDSVSFSGLAYVDGEFLALTSSGSILASEDGIDWALAYPPLHEISKEKRTGPSSFIGVVPFRRGFVALDGENALWFSREGSSCEILHYLPFKERVEGIASGNDTLLILEEKGNLYVSKNGTQWNKYRGPCREDERIALTYTSKWGFVIYGQCGVFASKDGVSWSRMVEKLPPGELSWSIPFFVCDGYLIAASENKKGDVARFWVSENGKEWKMTNLPSIDYLRLDGYPGIPPLPTALACGKGTLALVGSTGFLYASKNGVTWSKVNIDRNTRFTDVIHTGNEFIAVGAKGAIYSSPEGLSWTKEPSGTSRSLYGVTHRDGTAIAIGPWGLVLASKRNK
jgi:photosystem II stability/assembly factor-like uncharacterized protein